MTITLEEIIESDNMRKAYTQVRANKGAPGVDGVQTTEMGRYLKENWLGIKETLIKGTYRPSPVRKIEIPKPNGKMRMLGIPTVTDRMIQQAVSQVLTREYDAGFSEFSYGFRPKRKAHDAVRKAKEYLNEGYSFVVELDLEKFFDRVNHDKLMGILSKTIKDTRVLKLIRKCLKTGIMTEGRIEPREMGTPQGSPLSPVLSNILLDRLDKELERRGHRFIRYADDCSIYVKSRKAGERVLASITGYLEEELKLMVNREKSGIRRPREHVLLGFGFYNRNGYRIRIANKSVKAFMLKAKESTNKNVSKGIEEKMKQLNRIVRGWVNYFKIAEAKEIIHILDKWLRMRLRMCIWKSWKTCQNRRRQLMKLGISTLNARRFSSSRKGCCRISHSPILKTSITNNHLATLGFVSLSSVYES
jgi:group II intron reverse transcriptase/maturase